MKRRRHALEQVIRKVAEGQELPPRAMTSRRWPAIWRSPGRRGPGGSASTIDSAVVGRSLCLLSLERIKAFLFRRPQKVLRKLRLPDLTGPFHIRYKRL